MIFTPTSVNSRGIHYCWDSILTVLVTVDNLWLKLKLKVYFIQHFECEQIKTYKCGVVHRVNVFYLYNVLQTCVCGCVQLRGRASWRRQAAPFLPSAGLAGVGWVVVGHGAGWGTDVKACRLARRWHGGVWGREARVRQLELQVCWGVPRQNAVLHTLSEDAVHEHNINICVLLNCKTCGCDFFSRENINLLINS